MSVYAEDRPVRNGNYVRTSEITSAGRVHTQVLRADNQAVPPKHEAVVKQAYCTLHSNTRTERARAPWLPRGVLGLGKSSEISPNSCPSLSSWMRKFSRRVTATTPCTCRRHISRIATLALAAGSAIGKAARSRFGLGGMNVRS